MCLWACLCTATRFWHLKIALLSCQGLLLRSKLKIPKQLLHDDGGKAQTEPWLLDHIRKPEESEGMIQNEKELWKRKLDLAIGLTLNGIEWDHSVSFKHYCWEFAKGNTFIDKCEVNPREETYVYTKELRESFYKSNLASNSAAVRSAQFRATSCHAHTTFHLIEIIEERREGQNEVAYCKINSKNKS